MLNFFKNLLGGGANEILSEALADGAYLVDVRSTAEFKMGSVKGAVNIPLDQVGSQANKLKNKKHIVVFCRSGARSGQAKAILERKGFTNVINGGSVQKVRRTLENK